MELNNEIKNWVVLDNELFKLNKKIKEIRDKKKLVETNILDYVDTRELHNSRINISDGTLQFIKVKKTSTLTFKHLEDCLHKLFSDKDKVSQIIKFIKDSRDTNIVSDIKRTYNNE